MADFIIFIGQQWLLVSILLVLGFLFLRAETARGGLQISPHQLTLMINRDQALVLDLREATEYREGHIVDALHIPFSKWKERMGELEPYKQRPIVVVDKMGQHSGNIGRQLIEAGYNASRLSGGMSEWRASNLPVIKE